MTWSNSNYQYNFITVALLNAMNTGPKFWFAEDLRLKLVSFVRPLRPPENISRKLNDCSTLLVEQWQARRNSFVVTLVDGLDDSARTASRRLSKSSKVLPFWLRVSWSREIVFRVLEPINALPVVLKNFASSSSKADFRFWLAKSSPIHKAQLIIKSNHHFVRICLRTTIF